jgi:hypothetical protein
VDEPAKFNHAVIDMVRPLVPQRLPMGLAYALTVADPTILLANTSRVLSRNIATFVQSHTHRSRAFKQLFEHNFEAVGYSPQVGHQVRA